MLFPLLLTLGGAMLGNTALQNIFRKNVKKPLRNYQFKPVAPTPPPPPPKNPHMVTLEGELERARKRVTEDRGRLSGVSYPGYKGKMISPMSALTQRSRELRDRFAQKPAPYSGKIASVLARENRGLSPDAINQQIRGLSDKNIGFGKNALQSQLQQKFLSSYNPQRVNKFGMRLGQDTQSGSNELRGGLSDISRTSGTLDQTRNLQLAKTLQELQSQKKGRREALIGGLEQFGNQQHAANNFANSINRNQFDQELNAPHKRANRLEQVINSIESEMDQGMHPDLMQSKGKELQKAMLAYNNEGRYTGNLTTRLTPEILTSHNVLGNIDPKYKDASYDQRKSLRKELTNAPSVSESALAGIRESMSGKEANLERDSKERLEKDLRDINNKFVKLGQYGSQQHIDAAQNRAGEINRATLEQRNSLFQNTLKNQISSRHQDDIVKLQQLQGLGRSGQSEFTDMMNNLRTQNQLGATKWGNQQTESEDLYKNYNNEALWQWPHMKEGIRGQGRDQAFNDIFSGLRDRNISLDQLSKLNTNYSEIERERNNYQSELSSLREILARQQTEFTQQQQAADAQQRASAQRRAEAQADEADRLNKIHDQTIKDNAAKRTAYHTKQLGKWGPIYDYERSQYPVGPKYREALTALTKASNEATDDTTLGFNHGKLPPNVRKYLYYNY